MEKNISEKCDKFDMAIQKLNFEPVGDGSDPREYSQAYK